MVRVPKPTNRVVSSKRLHRLDGVKDVKIGRASVEARQRRNAKVTGGGDDDMNGYADVEERRKRFGFLY